MVWAQREVRALRNADREQALAVCAREPAAGVYVAARIGETDLDRARGVLLGYAPHGPVEAVCWASANFVPVGCDEAAASAFAHRLRRQQSQCSSIFGPAMEVAWMWDTLSSRWREPIELRVPQPLMAIPVDRTLRVAPDPRLRPATPADLDVLTPAAAAMFTEEIGYPPYRDQRGLRAYRGAVRALVGRGHAFVITEGDTVVFKADIGSVGVGACQIQGVWIDPAFRGQGIAAAAMAAVVQRARRVAPLVTLYVNHYNAAALATYRRVGFDEIGRFATILF
ncbi:GNAT family N-acetyltransferase [Mobilicoccus massiliensis]|uniref:GNAT family N-acetyltransferase n=1 Tax=Mobilicoccus massiliensis TaxID=1522310 RepID=UPI000694E6BE|nr:GNAT family N-acetyltransferase [Mobilicoccus massiliensis]